MAGALLLLGIVRRTLLLPGSPASLRKAAAPVAATAAVLWAVDPLCTESVTYIVQRAESLMAMLFLLTLYLVLRGATAAEKGTGTSQSLRASPLFRGAWYAAAIAACACGMAAKEVMVTAPVMVLLYDRIFLAGSFRQVFARRKWLYAGLAATWGVPGGAGGPVAQPGGGSAGVGQGVSVWSYVMTQFDAVARYLRLAFWPNTLVLDYGTGLAGSFAEVAGAAALIAGLLVAGALAVVAAEGGILGGVVFVILAPSSSFIPVVTQTSAEHRVYLSLAALAVAAAMVGWLGAARAWRDSSRRPGGGHGQRRWRRYRWWRRRWRCERTSATPITPARSQSGRPRPATGGPQRRAYSNLAQAYCNAGQYDQALEAAGKAIEVDAKCAAAYSVRGFVCGKAGQYQQALDACSAAIGMDPKGYIAWYNRALAYQSLGRTPEAIDDYSRAIELRPLCADALVNRGILRDGLGRYQQAIADFTEAIDVVRS